MGDKERIAKGMFQAVYLVDDKEIDQRWENLQSSVRKEWGFKAEIVTVVFKQLGYRKPRELLTLEERDIIRKEWWSTHGCYDDLIVQSAQAQLDQRGE